MMYTVHEIFIIEQAISINLSLVGLWVSKSVNNGGIQTNIRGERRYIFKCLTAVFEGLFADLKFAISADS